MTIEELTEVDRQIMASWNDPAGLKALHTIDGQAARIAELERLRGIDGERIDAALGRIKAEKDRRVEHRQMNQSLNEQVATLRAENERLRFLEELTSMTAAEWTQIRASLAAANTLLERARKRIDSGSLEDWQLPQDLDAHLARQPAAPTRTEADQAVLDAMREIPEHALEYWRVHGTVMQSNVAVAELARRKLKANGGEPTKERE